MRGGTHGPTSLPSFTQAGHSRGVELQDTEIGDGIAGCQVMVHEAGLSGGAQQRGQGHGVGDSGDGEDCL